ncbi:NIPSNAP family protein [Sphingomonas jatrophae]|uniref:NIPSNAP protein n=1 Tax=Sphingomonas jatrophae TaxID=1166337 RepID=A0A1I6M4D3_9SPHN|nr:NIPSNAP family protein [Sphingomonas jatrophae]SFS10488.1 NIPSNAP protein [Sphingomonas jatrophae]
MLYMKSEITVVPGHLPALLDLLNDRVFPIMESGSWRLIGCFVQRTGRLNTITDIWEMDGYAEFPLTYDKFRAHPDYPEIRVLLDTYIETETLVFMDARGGRLARQEI